MKKSSGHEGAAIGLPGNRGLKRGRLKIFLGYAPGVGKTRALLDAARRRFEAGADVVAGSVDTYGQRGGEEALGEFARVAAAGAVREELNLDVLLGRLPDLALVDDLAHTNPPGSRHVRRYQDVLELLNAGVDVYATLNVYHLESLNDVVAQITGVIVDETVPDHIFDKADEIELVDLPVDDLLQRLEREEIHVPDQATRELFRPGNLNALRVLAMRRAADRVDEQMRAYMQSQGISGPWPATERVLVCVSPSPLSERLVRTGRRLAARLNAELVAVYVETPRHAGLSEAERDRLARTLRLAEELGAKSISLPGNSVAETITEYGRRQNVTKIVAGRPLRARWTSLLTGSVVDQIIQQSDDIDVYVISGGGTRPDQARQVQSPTKSVEWRKFVQSAGLVALATLLGLPLRPFIEPTNLVMPYLLAVIVSAVRLGRAPAILASLLSVIAFDLVFVPPYYTFVVADAEYLLTFAALLGVGLVISALTARARRQARAAQRREAQTAVLYELSRDLAGAADLEDVAGAVVRQVEQTLGAGSRAAVLIHDGEELRLTKASTAFRLDGKERTVAAWVYKHNEAAGRNTETLTEAAGLYLPLKTANEMVGVLGVAPAEREKALAAEQQRLLESFASQAALAIERSRLAEKARQAQLLHETEKLQTALLNSISHDLRTPLASITGALSSLRDDAGLLNADARSELIRTAYDEAERLNRLVGNLLNMTRLESGALRISADAHDVEDVIGVALAQLEHRLQERDVHVEVADGLPLTPMDFVLMVQVFVNLLENACKYSPAPEPLEIHARTSAEELLIDVMDRGPGIPPEELERIFNKFYRHEGLDDAGGTGLGLSISQGIVEAHGGRIWAHNREGGGSTFTVALPLQPADEVQPEPVL